MGRIGKARSILEEYHKAAVMVRDKGKSVRVPTQWVRPTGESLKLNFDAAFKEGEMVGMGVVLRDGEGEVLMAMCASWKGKCAIHEGEAMAAKQGTKIAMEAGFLQFVLETDCVMVFEALKRGKREASPFGLLLHDIFILLSQCGTVSFN